MSKLSIAAAVVLVAVAASPAFAAKSGKPVVNGQATNVGLMQQNNTIALGIDAEAKTRVGAVRDGKFNGTLTNVGLVGQNNTIALGIQTEARTDAGVVHNGKVNGDLTNVGLMGQNNTIALGIQSKAKTEVGTFGK